MPLEPVAVEEERRSLVENLLLAMRSYGGGHPQACILERPGAIAVYSGRPGAIFNSVLLDRAVSGEAELRDIFAWAQDQYAKRGARWSLWLVEHFVPAGVLPKVAALLEPYGLAAQHRSQGMVAHGLAPVDRALPPLEFLPILAPAARFDFCYVMSQAFDTALATYLDIYHQPLYWEGALFGYVGYHEHRAIASACYLASRDAIGLYGVATLPASQRRGFGERLIRYLVAEAQRATGLSRLVLEASDRAVPLYRRLGFRRIATVTVYNEVH